MKEAKTSDNTDRDARALKVHYDKSGRSLWYILGNGTCVQYGGWWRNFTEEAIFNNAPYVRFIGGPDNSVFVSHAYEIKRLKQSKAVEVCSPMVCATAAERNNPEQVLMNMRRWKWPSSLGGWHEVDTKCYQAHKLAAAYTLSNSGSSENLIRILLGHPAWPSLSFIGHIDKYKCVQLLSLLVDPRWYIDFKDPDSGAKLKAFLGLTPKTQGYINGQSGFSGGLHADRCKLVMDCWKTSDQPPKDVHHPKNFLWRIWQEHGSGYIADLRTSQAFVSFLRHTWLDELYVGKRPGDPLFIPEYYFKVPEDAQFYKKHLEKTRNNASAAND